MSAGYGKPPSATQFKKGQSGNPKGRPKNRHKSIPYDAVLGQMVTIREDGHERRVTAAQAHINSSGQISKVEIDCVDAKNIPWSSPIAI